MAIAGVVVDALTFAGLARVQTQVDEVEVDDDARGEDKDAAPRERFVLGRTAYRGADYGAALCCAFTLRARCGELR